RMRSLPTMPSLRRSHFGRDFEVELAAAASRRWRPLLPDGMWRHRLVHPELQQTALAGQISAAWKSARFDRPPRTCTLHREHHGEPSIFGWLSAGKATSIVGLRATALPRKDHERVAWLTGQPLDTRQCGSQLRVYAHIARHMIGKS